MSLSAVSYTNFLAPHNPLVAAVKAGVLAFAWNAIQGLGVLAQSGTSVNLKGTELKELEYAKNYFNFKLERIDESLNEFQTIPRRWGPLKFLHRSLCENVDATLCFKPDILKHLNYVTFVSDLSYMSGRRYVNSYERKTDLGNAVHEEFLGFCKRVKDLFRYYAIGPHYEVLLGCNSPDLLECVNSDPQKRKSTLKLLASSIQTILPKNSKESQNVSIKDCFSPEECSNIDKDKVPEKERMAAEAAYTTKTPENRREELKNWFASKFVPPEWLDVQEVLRFRSDDPREKFLLSVADYDHNDALAASNLAGILSSLSQKFDLKFQVVKEHKDICKSVESGGKTGNLVHVMLGAHGNPELMVFDTEVDSKGEVFLKDGIHESDSSYFSKCFSPLQPNGKINLMSCSTGAMKEVGTKKEPRKSGLPFDNIAQKMANAAKRVVVAPRDLAHPGLSKFLSDDGVLYEKEKQSKSGLYSFLPFYTNLFSSFRPVFKKCFPEINIEGIHQRELSALDVIKSELISKSLIHKDEPPGRANEYLQICSDDPREKLLFFVSEYDKNGAMEPKLTPEMLGLFADRFDLQYKVVKSLPEICQRIDRAAKAGTVSNVVILSHGTATEGMTLSKDSSDNKTLLKASDEFAKCFSGLEKHGSIILMGSSLGQKGGDKNNIAQRIANDSKRTVLATTCPIVPSDIKIKSINPLIMEHEQYSRIYNYLFKRCPENNQNHFKTFVPKKSEQKTKLNHEDL